MTRMTQPEPLPILWLDDDIVAVHKPAGWLVHRTGLDAHETRFVMQTLRDQLGGAHVYPVHRLDKGTSGVLLMARHPDAARILSLDFEHQRVDKHYIAMVRGWPKAVTWEVDHALRQDDAPHDAEPQAARTTFHRLAMLQIDVPVDRYPTTRAALVEAVPHTGRRHQIRRHLKHVSNPIIGDATHGKGPHNRWWAERLALRRMWLHAWSLAFRHPRTGEGLQLCSEIAALHAVLGDAVARPAPTAGAGPGDTALNADWARVLNDLPWQPDEGQAPPAPAHG